MDLNKSTIKTGADSQVLLAGRDIVVGRTLVPNADFFEPNLEEVAPPQYETPPIADQLKADLLRDRMLILSGRSLEDKTLAARHIAWHLLEDLCQQGTEVEVAEWYQTHELRRLDAAFHRDGPVKIFLLPQIEPHITGYDLGRVDRALRASGKHFAIVTTTLTRSQWSEKDRSGAESGCWRELTNEEWHDSNSLAAFLLEELERLEPWPTELVVMAPDSSDTSIIGLSTRNIAGSLKSRRRIRSFVTFLNSLEPPIKPAAVKERLQQMRGDAEAVKQWYQQLEPRQQLLATGLTLLHGLFDDQAFAGLEVLVDHAWRSRSPLMAQFDYSDVDGLTPYLRLGDPSAPIARLQPLEPEIYQATLEVAWRLHRRQISAALPVLAMLIQNSGGRIYLSDANQDDGEGETELGTTGQSEATRVNRDSSSKSADKANHQRNAKMSRWEQHGPDRELYGSRIRTEQLRRVLGEAFSYFGLLSFQAVEPSLLEIASDSSEEVQLIAANALADWYNKGRNDLFFDTLQAWQNESRLLAVIKRAVKRRRSRKLTNIRATVALTVGYAVQYDRPGELSGRLRGLLEMFLEDDDRLVRRRFISFTLPWSIAFHFRELKVFLRESVLLYPDMVRAVAHGIALAYYRMPEEVAQALREWHLECSSAQPGGPDVSVRETLYATVALSYGYIGASNEGDDTKEPSGAHGISDTMSALQKILADEAHPFVRAHALLAIEEQASSNFSRIEPWIRAIVGELALEERSVTVRILTRAYLNQRHQLEGGDEAVSVGEYSLRIPVRNYAVWTETPRPLTGIETTMYCWALDSTFPVGQQVAVQAFAAFAETHLDERERAIISEKEEKKNSSKKIVKVPSLPDNRLHVLSLLGKISLVLSSPRYARTVLRSLLPSLLEEYQEGSLVLQRWTNTKEDTIRRTASQLGKALWIQRHWKPLLASVSCVFALLLGASLL